MSQKWVKPLSWPSRQLLWTTSPPENITFIIISSSSHSNLNQIGACFICRTEKKQLVVCLELSQVLFKTSDLSVPECAPHLWLWTELCVFKFALSHFEQDAAVSIVGGKLLIVNTDQVFSRCFRRQAPEPIFVLFHWARNHSGWCPISGSAKLDLFNLFSGSCLPESSSYWTVDCSSVFALVFVFDKCSICFQDVTCLKVQPGLKPLDGEVELDLKKPTDLLMNRIKSIFFCYIFLVIANSK